MDKGFVFTFAAANMVLDGYFMLGTEERHGTLAGTSFVVVESSWVASKTIRLVLSYLEDNSHCPQIVNIDDGEVIFTTKKRYFDSSGTRVTDFICSNRLAIEVGNKVVITSYE